MPAGRTEDSGGRNRAPFQGTSRSTWARQTRQAMLEEKSAISRIARPRPRIEGIVFGLRQSGHLEDRETGQGRDQGHEETDEDRVPGQLARAPRKQDKKSETGARERIWPEPVRSARRNAGREVGASSSFDLDRHLLTGLRSPHAGPEYRSPNSGAAEGGRVGALYNNSTIAQRRVSCFSPPCPSRSSLIPPPPPLSSICAE